MEFMIILVIAMALFGIGETLSFVFKGILLILLGMAIWFGGWYLLWILLESLSV